MTHVTRSLTAKNRDHLRNPIRSVSVPLPSIAQYLCVYICDTELWLHVAKSMLWYVTIVVLQEDNAVVMFYKPTVYMCVRKWTSQSVLFVVHSTLDALGASSCRFRGMRQSLALFPGGQGLGCLAPSLQTLDHGPYFFQNAVSNNNWHAASHILDHIFVLHHLV